MYILSLVTNHVKPTPCWICSVILFLGVRPIDNELQWLVAILTCIEHLNLPAVCLNFCPSYRRTKTGAKNYEIEKAKH